MWRADLLSRLPKKKLAIAFGVVLVFGLIFSLRGLYGEYDTNPYIPSEITINLDCPERYKFEAGAGFYPLADNLWCQWPPKGHFRGKVLKQGSNQLRLKYRWKRYCEDVFTRISIYATGGPVLKPSQIYFDEDSTSIFNFVMKQRVQGGPPIDELVFSIQPDGSMLPDPKIVEAWEKETRDGSWPAMDTVVSHIPHEFTLRCLEGSP